MDSPFRQEAQLEPSEETRYCQRCGHQQADGEVVCPDCSCWIYGPRVLASARPRRRAAHPLYGPLAHVGLPLGRVLALYGPPGAGKSSLAMTAFKAPYVLTTEMDATDLLDYSRRMHRRLSGISAPRLVDTPEGLAVDLNLPELLSELVYDSLSAGVAELATLKALMAYCSRTGCRCIVIMHETKDGSAAGLQRLRHEVHAVARIFKEGGHQKIDLLKNRSGRLSTSIFSLGSEGPAAVRRDRFYSVEGDGPHYRLVAHPGGPGLKHAAYFLAIEEAKEDADSSIPRLPPPPLAVAAQYSRLYQGGWIEPEDWEQRRTFALENGVSYYSPVEHKTWQPPSPLTSSSSVKTTASKRRSRRGSVAS